MKYSVTLQEPFDYALFWLLIGAGLIAAALILYGIRRYSAGKKILPDPGSVRLVQGIRLWLHKRRHTKNIRKIETEFNKGAMDARAAHQNLSREVRAFASAATGKPMESLVYTEIRQMNYPQLAGFIEALYAPEFAAKSETEIRTMILKSKELIKKWR